MWKKIALKNSKILKKSGESCCRWEVNSGNVVHGCAVIQFPVSMFSFVSQLHFQVERKEKKRRIQSDSVSLHNQFQLIGRGEKVPLPIGGAM